VDDKDDNDEVEDEENGENERFPKGREMIERERKKMGKSFDHFAAL